MNRVSPARLLAGSALFFFAVASPLIAQSDPGAIPRREALRVVAYPLESANPDETQNLLESLFHGDGPLVRITSDARTNTVIVYAPDSVHTHVRDLIGTLDRPVKQTQVEMETETRVLIFQHITVDSLRPVVQLHNVQIATNAATNSLIVRGKTVEIERVVQTLRAIDVETPSVELECWLLESGRGTQIGDHVELKGLAPELARAGLEGFGVFSHMAVRSLAGEKFDSSQSFVNRRLRNMALGGVVRLVDQGKTAQIGIGISISMQLDELVDSKSSGSFQLNTELSTQPGKLVVVGLAPTGDESAKPLVLVLRVKK